jgi:hypothetical protein
MSIISRFTCIYCSRVRDNGRQGRERGSRVCYRYINEVEDVATNQNIQMTPTFKFFKNGLEVAKMTGSDFEKLTALVAQHK